MRLLLLAIGLIASISSLKAETATPSADAEPQAMFQRLKNLAGDSSLDFQTSFALISKTRPERGDVHLQIKRPNLFRIDGTAGRSK